MVRGTVPRRVHPYARLRRALEPADGVRARVTVRQTIVFPLDEPDLDRNQVGTRVVSQMRDVLLTLSPSAIPRGSATLRVQQEGAVPWARLPPPSPRLTMRSGGVWGHCEGQMRCVHFCFQSSE